MLTIDLLRRRFPYPDLDMLFYWIKERETIRLAKKNGERWPWTDDEILRTYRFCNVRRMDDKVSQWLMNNWYNKPFFESLGLEQVRAVALARFINKPETLMYLSQFVLNNTLIDTDGIKRIIRQMKEAGATIFNSAYMVRGNDGVDKISSVIDYYIESIDNRISINGQSMKEDHTSLNSCYGFGSFMAGQVIADLRYIFPKKPWKDRMTWAPIGPGSARGLNRLMGLRVDSKIAKQNTLDEYVPMVLKKLSRLWKSWGFGECRLEAMDIQNCFCEFDKYCRTVYEEGRPKQLYGVSYDNTNKGD